MTAKRDGRVLVVPTADFHAIGVFQGCHPHASDYLPRLLRPDRLCYRPRSEGETDPGFTQITPYVVLRYRDQVFHYTRGKAASETRLQTLRSLGVGGHISEGDTNLFEDAYRQGMLREVDEEVLIETSYRERCIG